MVWVLSTSNSHAQNPVSLLWEPEFSVNIETESPWSFSLGLANRMLLTENLDGEKVSGFNNEHTEINHFTSYSTGENTEAALGIRYRFREIYDDSRYDELRIVEQFTVSHPNSAIGLKHRFRVEQRFRNIETIHRFRYALGASQTLNEVFSLGFSTEALLEIARESKPSLEQRFGLELKNSSFDNLEISTGLEYQLDGYNNELEHQFYILSGVALDI